MEIGDISLDLDQAEENNLVEDVYIYWTKGKYLDNCAANRKRVIRRKAEKFRVRNRELFYIKKKSRKVNYGQKTSAFISYSATYMYMYTHTSLIVLHIILWEMLLTNLR